MSTLTGRKVEEKTKKAGGEGYWAEEFNGMPYVKMGNSGLKVSKMGIGTWKFGYPEKGDGSRVDGKTALKILDRAFELGVTFWDTANRYNNASGNSERIIGEWLKTHPEERRSIIIATKMCGLMDGITPNHCGLSRTNILESVYASLKRLQTSYIDLLYFHNMDENVPIKEQLEAVKNLMDRDLIRYFGLSNVNLKQLQAYIWAAEKYNLPSPIAVQNYFNPLDGEKKGFEGVLDFCAKNGIAFVPYSPLKRGLLTGRYEKGKSARKGDRLFDENLIEEYTSEETYGKLEKLKEIADKNKISMAQQAMSYIMQMRGMGGQIPSVSSVQQLEEHAAAAKIKLSEETLRELEKTIKGGEEK